MDLTVIALLQLSALAYGVWTVAEGRPVWLSLNGWLQQSPETLKIVYR